MKIFLTWSGSKSRRVAEVLRDWLPNVIQVLEPWISSEYIEKGSLWSATIAERLKTSKAGIICVTDSNAQAPWLNFEAGAISNRLETSLVCTFLVGPKPTDLVGPLTLFQATLPTRLDVRRLLGTLNKALEGAALEEKRLDRAFDLSWPSLESDLKSLDPEDERPKPQRNEREMLEETLEIVRGLQQNLQVGRTLLQDTAAYINNEDASPPKSFLFYQPLRSTKQQYDDMVVSLAKDVYKKEITEIKAHNPARRAFARWSVSQKSSHG